MKQFKLFASLVVSVSLLPAVTFASVSSKDAAIAVAYDWTGFYAGLNAGLVNHTMKITDNQATSFNATIEQVSNPKFTGGLQAGYRRQLDMSSVSGVYGLEFSVDFADAEFKKEYGSPFALYQLRSKNTLNNTYLLELMGGIAADRTLLFLAAGVSWANITGRMTNIGGIPYFEAFKLNKNPAGTAIGGGIEYAFNQKLSARLKVDVIMPNSYTATDNLDNEYQISNNIVQGVFGVNYRFG